MKKINLAHLLATCFLGVLMANFSACKKDDPRASLIGTWNLDRKNGNIISRESYQFNTDSTFLFLHTALDTTGKLLGYYHKSSGKFRYSGKALYLYELTYWKYPDGAAAPYYTALQNLVVSTSNTLTTSRDMLVEFSSDKRSVKIVSPCGGPAITCIVPMPYIKQ
jgi:hypothetical protein